MILRFGFAAERSWYFDMADGELFNLLCGSLICSIGWTGPPPPVSEAINPCSGFDIATHQGGCHEHRDGHRGATSPGAPVAC